MFTVFPPHYNPPCRSGTAFGAANHLFVLSFLFSRFVFECRSVRYTEAHVVNHLLGRGRFELIYHL